MENEKATGLPVCIGSLTVDDMSMLPAPGLVKSLISKFQNDINDKDEDSEITSSTNMPIKPEIIESDCEEEKKKKESDSAEKSAEPVEISKEENHGLSKNFPWRKSFSKGRKSRAGSQFYSSTSNETSEIVASPNVQATILPTDVEDEVDEVDEIDCGTLASFAKIDLEEDRESLQSIQSSQSAQSVQPGKPPMPLAKSYLVARELVTSEEKYLNAIEIINNHFREFIVNNRFGSKVKVISEANLHKVLQHFPEIQTLHEDLLYDIKIRLENWEINPKIADVFIKKGAFLKLYATYFKNFTAQTKFLDDLCLKNVHFDKLVKDFESSDICRKLTIQHYMLKPVQRIAQYKLLFGDYLKYLSKDSPDYEDTKTALKVIMEALEFVNNSMKAGDQAERMVQLQSMLGGFQLIQPGRELIKDGPLMKVCRKSVQERHFILLNDCLLYATPLTSYLSLQHTLPLVGMKACYKTDDSKPFAFAIFSRAKSVLVCAKSETEREEWVDALNVAVESYASRKKSFMTLQGANLPDTVKLGKEAPLWVPDKKVTMCQDCTAGFTHLFRRHHCRACGKVCCWKCSDNVAPLQYKNYKASRVCINCFQQLFEDFEEDMVVIKKSFKNCDDEESLHNQYLKLKSSFVMSKYAGEVKQKKDVPKRVTEVPAKDAEASMAGWLKKWIPEKGKWEKKWYVLKDRALYVYGASEDVAASKSFSVLGFDFEKGYEGTFSNINPLFVFRMVHKQHPPMVFQTDDPATTNKWLFHLNEATDIDKF